MKIVDEREKGGKLSRVESFFISDVFETEDGVILIALSRREGEKRACFNPDTCHIVFLEGFKRGRRIDASLVIHGYKE